MKFLLKVLGVLALIWLVAVFATHVLITPGVAHAIDASKFHCNKGVAEKKVNGHILGIDTGKTLFWGRMEMYACANRKGRIVSWSEPTVYGEVTGFGGNIGWHNDGVYPFGSGGPKVFDNGRQIRAKRVIHFSQSVPTPIGTWKHRDYYMKLIIVGRVAG